MGMKPVDNGRDWLRALRAYFSVILIGNLIWESLHLPLYTVWTQGSRGENLFAVVHCTGGDLLIAASSLIGSLLFLGTPEWPRQRFASVALATIILGVAYTGFSEWLNVSVRRSWMYSEWMPVLPIAGGIGASPVLQWLTIPALAFWFCGLPPIYTTTRVD